MPGMIHLFKPAHIGPMELKNRIIMAPMGTFSCQNGRMSEETMEYYAARAKGGAGLIITQITAISPRAPGGKTFCALWDDEFIPNYRELARRVHQYGAKIATQLGHHGLQHSDPGRLLGYRREDIDVVGPSPVVYLPTGIAPHELSKKEIKGLVEQFAQAGRRTKEAGLDAVEIHGAHGRLVNQFLSPFYNRRNDEYGGSAEKRARFAGEIIERMRQLVGREFPILIRISGEEDFTGGGSLEESVRQAAALEEAGADAIDISIGVQEFSSRIIPIWIFSPGITVSNAHAIKKAVKVPVIAVGRMTAVLGERVLREGKADFIAFARPLLADPDLPRKAQEGKVSSINMCISCNNCMVSVTKNLLGGQEVTGRPLQCTVNPALFREKDFQVLPARTPKKVLVAGGGLAGMHAAVYAACRGHRVTIFEKSDCLGGQWNAAGELKWTGHYAGVTKRLVRELKSNNVVVVFNTVVNKRLITVEKPDSVIVATGAVPSTIDVPGSNRKNVIKATDFLLNKPQLGDRIAVIGGARWAIQIACQLAAEGKKIVFITEEDSGKDVEKISLHGFTAYLANREASFYPYSHPVEILAKGIAFFSKPLGFVELPVDNIVLALQPLPENSLIRELKGLIPELQVIGDCREPRSALEAMNEGAEIGIRI